MHAATHPDRPGGRDPDDRRTIDLEQWLADQRERRLGRLRALHPERAMLQLPLELDGFW